MYRYFNYKQTYAYLPVLTDMVNNYNNTPHSSLELAPANVTSANEADLILHLYYPAVTGEKITKTKPKRPKARSVFKFKVGDKVRL